LAKVLILIGSNSDRVFFDDAAQYANYFGLDFELEVISAHRDPDKLRIRVARAEEEGTDVIIAAAGMAAHLAGACAAQSILPVIGVPLPNSELNGLDALLSTVQMPTGVPVATVAIGKVGARNALVLAAQIIARKEPEIGHKIREFKARGSRL
jgi:phosphoribosylaminoimidazole carboxylase PurE protein